MPPDTPADRSGTPPDRSDADPADSPVMRDPALPDRSDADLIAGSRTDPEKFGPIFDRHAVAVHGFLTRRAGRDLADELLSEVFTVAFDLRRRYDRTRDDARPWLYGIAHNVLRSRWRGENRRRGLLVRLPPEPSSNQQWDDVDRRLDADGPGRRAAAALAKLPQGEREVIQLVAWEELPLTEVARVLRIPEGTARSRLHRARATLRTALGPAPSDPLPAPAVEPHSAVANGRAAKTSSLSHLAPDSSPAEPRGPLAFTRPVPGGLS